MNEKNCGNCKFIFNVDKEHTRGACRRLPPTVMVCPIPVQMVVGSPPEISWQHQASAFPMVSATAWCGEHQDAPSAIFNS